jgi:hypothetical protein
MLFEMVESGGRFGDGWPIPSCSRYLQSRSKRRAARAARLLHLSFHKRRQNRSRERILGCGNPDSPIRY